LKAELTADYADVADFLFFISVIRAIRGKIFASLRLCAFALKLVCQSERFLLPFHREPWFHHDNDDLAFILQRAMNADASTHVFEAFLFMISTTKEHREHKEEWGSQRFNVSSRRFLFVPFVIFCG